MATTYDRAEIDRLNREAEALIEAAIVERSIGTAKEAGEYVGRVAGLALADMSLDQGTFAFKGVLHELDLSIKKHAEAQGMSPAEIDPLWRAFWRGLAEVTRDLAATQGGHA